MDFRNISPLGDLHIPALGVEVAAGDVFTVKDEALAASLLEQPTNFEAVVVKPVKQSKADPA